MKKRGLLDEAASYFQKVIDINPKCVEAYENLGNILKEKSYRTLGGFNRPRLFPVLSSCVYGPYIQAFGKHRHGFYECFCANQWKKNRLHSLIVIFQIYDKSAEFLYRVLNFWNDFLFLIYKKHVH